MRTAILVAFWVVVSFPVLAEPHSCQAAVDAEIARLGVSPERVSKYIVMVETYSDNTASGYKVWMRLKSCRTGFLVVDTDLHCNIVQTYTDGACLVTGVPSY